MALNTVPAVRFVRLPSDHMQATSQGKLTPKAYDADNACTLGQLVDTVPHSTIWRDTAIFVTEDDARNGRYRVDVHGTQGLAIGP